VDGYGITFLYSGCYLLHKLLEPRNVSRQATIINREIMILNAASAAFFLLQQQVQFLHFIFCEHGDKNINPGIFQPSQIIAKPVSTAWTRSNGQPIELRIDPIE